MSEAEESLPSSILSDEKIKLLEANFEDYCIYLYEPKFGSNHASYSLWTLVVEQILRMCSTIGSVDDILTDTLLEDLELADDIFSLINEVRQV